jgi:hypothetical protein
MLIYHQNRDTKQMAKSIELRIENYGSKARCSPEIETNAKSLGQSFAAYLLKSYQQTGNKPGCSSFTFFIDTFTSKESSTKP